MSNITNHLAKLNPAQKQAVLHQTGPAIVLAGAGSGKTRVLTTRAAWLIEKGQAQPHQILLVTFTNKAAGEMNQRVHRLTGAKLPFSGTFHGLCAKILRQHAPAVGLDRSYLIYDTSDQNSLLKQIIKKLEINTKKYKPRAIKAKISAAKNEMLSVQAYQQQASNDFQEIVARVYKLYQHDLIKQNAVDFDDLLLKVVELFKNNQQILTQYQEQLTHVLVDEYQDTNKAQYQLTKFFSQPQNNLYVVGDFSQSIYAWRGADYRNLFYLQQDYDQLAEYKLEQNYRSTQTIVSAATKLISQNTSHPILELWTNKTSSEKITILETDSSRQEASTVLHLIKNQLLPTYQYQDMAILYRTNAQSRAFEEAFIKAGVPYKLIGGFKFYERKEIKDLLAYLRLMVNPLDSVSQERVLKIGKRRYQTFEAWQDSRSATSNQTSDNQPFTLLKGILKATNYLNKFDQKDPEDQARLENIQELLNTAAQFEDVNLFLENVSLVQDEQLKDLPPDEQQNQVTMMSLHSAKGLEFPVVFIVGFEDGLLPHSRCLFDKEQLEEERRLCYVGITRAQEKLYLSFTNTRYLYGRSQATNPSRFLQQIPSDLTIYRRFTGLGESYGQTNSHKIKTQKKGHQTQSHQTRRTEINLEMNDDELEALLNDEIKIKDFLDS